MTLAAHHSTEQLWAAYTGCGCAVAQRRIQFIALLSEGRSRREALSLTRYSGVWGIELMQRYNAQGLEGLMDGRASNPGAPRLLSPRQLHDLAQTVHVEYAQGMVWNAAKVKTWLEQTLGHAVHVQRAFELLHLIGFSQQQPRPQHAQADLVAQEAFQKNPG